MNSKISKKNIALISTLGIFLLIGFIGIPELTRNMLFYPDAPTAVGSLEPDIPVPFTFADFKAGIDASLSSIISIESSN
tara:strand:- start:400 stop:636 length:237 start_codon:yes stop_codon:yes gene_type:complete